MLNLDLIHEYLCLTWKGALFIPLRRALLLELLQRGERWWGCWNVRLSQLTPSAISHRWWLTAHASCQEAKPSSDKQVARLFCGHGSPRAFLCSHPTAAPVVMFPSRPLMSLLGPQCPSLALLHPLCCWQHPAGPQELQFYRTMTMPGQHKIPPLAELSPPPAGQLSSPTHGSLFWAGFWYLSHRKREKNCPRRTDFALANSSRMKLEAKRCLSLPVSLHPLPHAFYCWLFYFLSCSLLVVWDEMKDF